ncbi:PAS domain S-box-containing protein/diguanylate cyclase (GGDEF) domain-containing protein [Ectothiorhodospira mobilis]|uniref:PAS domain S-box-containing protein/diguanylate cyclase (GGDEF) domain-containing protein n=1 Tax=Ectothiorhodospira mobilis TaxID=195064 RepID=A0A1I4R4E3_ECTMO|nr:EAL domain-containing protein [Ectothiorhodospira mobilis]SFM46793.1 PAS domain S-box-containing protein/diguanylate cyclase (GGDEF) domain-containing protein [Ectothiorhodospira mobilis]
MQGRRFISLKWKLLGVFGGLILLLLATFALFNHYNLERQYHEQRVAEQTRARHQLEGLVEQSRTELINLAQLLPALSGIRDAVRSGSPGAIGERFSPLWTSLQVDADLALAAFFDREGRVLHQDHLIASPCQDCQEIRAAVARVLELERPEVFIHCRRSCLIHAVAPILADGETIGAMLVGRSLANLVLTYRGISRMEVAVLAGDPGRDAPPDLRPWHEGGDVVAITHGERTLPLLNAAGGALAAALGERLPVQTAAGRFELMPMPMPGETLGRGPLTVVSIADVTGARQRIAAARLQNVLIGLGGLGVFALLVMAVSHAPLSRLRRVARLLPLLAERRFQEVRSHLPAAAPQRAADELALLERTTLVLADRLERLEADVQRQNRSLAERMQELSVERERYALAAAGANDGLWDWNLETNQVFYSPRWKEMLGLAPDAPVEDPAAWFTRVHPDDQSALQRALERHLEGQQPWLEHEYRMRLEGNGHRWMRVRGLAVRREDGLAYRIAGSMTDITEQRRIQEQLRHDALHDALTGLPNRTLFLDRLRQAIFRTHRAGYRFAVLFLDLDDFKTINDSLGHLQGDRVLVQAARRLEGVLRPGDTVARLGGDEFSILLEGIVDTAEAEAVVRRVQEAFARPIRTQEQDVFVRFSVGIATESGGDASPEDLLRNADTAMYQAKRRSRGGSAVFDLSMHTSAVQRLSLETSMRRALDQEAFQLHYQPIVCLQSGRLAGFEALARWPRVGQKPVSPADFIPLAEQNGLILPLGRWVIQSAVAWAAHWYHHGGQDHILPVNINVSGHQLGDPGLMDVVTGALEDHGIPGACIKVEFTESAIMENTERARAFMEALKARGIALCIDDFGTGYSSLSQLRDLPFDVVKIDRSFVRHLGGADPRHEAMLRALVSIIRALDKSTVAEGVETRAQAARLLELGCDLGQGFLFSPALAPQEAERLVASWQGFAPAGDGSRGGEGPDLG